ncbi:MAG: methylenetetrahydrofolate reductase C-terminal domain-containing protein [Thermodesulfovibrionales bacterium]|nr:methylenetetrahydrofolate reductase C-terminal domain-containing protein [Thermodesulfovibrionales bacterium]
MYTITKQKPFEEIEQSLDDKKVYIVGCGTCATVCQTGGKAEVLEMKMKLEEIGRSVTGWMVIPTVCDSLTKEALIEEAEAVNKAGVILVMSCSFGVQTVSRYSDKIVIPALNTLFIGMEDTPEHFYEICKQCGECILALTGGICPITRCAKGLLNGPCGGSQGGKCEISPDLPCAWQLIIERLSKTGRLHKLEEIIPPKNWGLSPTGWVANSKR